MKKAFRIAVILILLITGTAVMVQTVFAISSPDSDPSVSNLHINRHLLMTDDILIYGDYDIPYATPPDTFADDAYIFKLIASDNTTELGAVTPFVFFDNGYNEGVFGLYFANQTTANITWGNSYTLRIAQNPASFAVPTEIDYTIPTNIYTSATTNITNRTELAINIINAANRLEQVHTSYTLLDGSAGGTVLYSPTGETYFDGAIYGIRAMAPSLFMVQVLEYDTSYRTWTTDYSDNQTERFDATFIGASENVTATQFGTTQSIFGFIPLVICFGAVIISLMKFRRAEPGFIVCAPIIIWGFLSGWIPGALFATAFQAMGIYLSFVWFYSRG